MVSTGIICEYNPFHHGHLHQVNSILEKNPDRLVVCLMSSNFLQRGEPSIIDKYARARCAIQNGADLVIELPSVFSCSSAEYFAQSSILMFQRLGIIDTLSFGSESGNLPLLKKIAKTLLFESSDYREALKAGLAKGLSFPGARESALKSVLDHSEVQDVIGHPNNILAIEYLKAMALYQAEFSASTIIRKGSAYTDDTISSSFPSATAIRKLILNKGLDAVVPHIPSPTYKVMKEEFDAGRGPVSMENFKDIVPYRISSMSRKELAEYPFMSEGLENRLLKGMENAGTVSGLVDTCSTKRYPKTRISRAIFHIVLGITDAIYQKAMETGPQYAHVLGASPRGESLFPIMQRNALIPFFTSLKGFYERCSKTQRALLDIEIRACNIYASVTDRRYNREFTRKFEI
ncbi:MAG: nucleotidyltransferase family protein [Clostridia bacterium]